MQPDPIDTPPSEPVLAEPPILEPAPLPAPRDPFWNYIDLLLMIGAVASGILVIGFLGLVLVSVIPHLKANPAPIALPLQLVFYVVVYFGFVAVFKFRYRAPVLASLGWRHARFNPFLAIVIGAALAIALSAFGQLLHTPENDLIDKVVDSPASLVLFAVTAVLIAPVFEELFFRGLIQPLLSRTFGIVAGVLITAVLFGGLHAPEYSWAWQYALIISFAGAVFGWARARTGSIVPGVLMHCSFNSISVIGYIASSHFKLK